MPLAITDRRSGIAYKVLSVSEHKERRETRREENDLAPEADRILKYATLYWRNCTSVTGSDKSTLDDNIAQYTAHLNQRSESELRLDAFADGRPIDHLEMGLRFVNRLLQL